MSGCPICGSEIKSIPAGISKKSGKPYNAFQVCSNSECLFKPIDEEGRTKEVRVSMKPSLIKSPDEYVEGKKENARLMTRNALMCEVVKVFGQMGSLNEQEIIKMFNLFWAEIEK